MNDCNSYLICDKGIYFLLGVPLRVGLLRCALSQGLNPLRDYQSLTQGLDAVAAPLLRRCLSLSCLGVADAVARGCRCSRSRRGRSVHGRSSRQPRTSSRTPPQGQGSLRPFSELAFSADTHSQVWPSAAQIHTGIPRSRSPSPEGGVFLVRPLWLILSLYGSRGSPRSPGTAVASSSSPQVAE